MKGGSVQEFMDHATYEEVAVIYQGVKYFFHGLIQAEDGKYSFDIDIWNNNGDCEKTIFAGTFQSKVDCILTFEKSKIFDGKAFWEAEKDMEWIEW